MTDSRSPLDVSVVIDRFVAAERLLTEATEKVGELGKAAQISADNTQSVAEVSRSVALVVEQLSATAEELRTAHAAMADAMELARRFLEATDLPGLHAGFGELKAQVTQLAANQQQHFEYLAAVLNRQAELQKERDELARRLEEVLQQVPGRVAKRLRGTA